MTYNPAIPAGGDKPSVSQGQMLTNFTQLNTQFGTEHTALNAASNNGKHKYVTLPVGPGITPAGTDFALSIGPTIDGNQYLQCNTTTQKYGVPLIVSVGGNIAHGTHTIYDFNTLPLADQFGTVMVVDTVTGFSTVFTTFVWFHGALNIPSSSGNYFSQGNFDYLSDSGSKLQLTNTGGATTFYLKITGSVF